MTGGGSASRVNLSDLEEKIMSIIGSQAATGILDIPEIGLEVGLILSIIYSFDFIQYLNKT
jgi:hypothetical protein